MGKYVKPSLEEVKILTTDIILSSGIKTNESNHTFNNADESI